MSFYSCLACKLIVCCHVSTRYFHATDDEQQQQLGIFGVISDDREIVGSCDLKGNLDRFIDRSRIEFRLPQGLSTFYLSKYSSYLCLTMISELEENDRESDLGSFAISPDGQSFSKSRLHVG